MCLQVWSAKPMQMVNELEAVAETFHILLNEAMKIERDQSLGAGLYERTDNQRRYPVPLLLTGNTSGMSTLADCSGRRCKSLIQPSGHEFL